MPLRISKNEPPIQVSKWLKVPLLLDYHEMEALLKELGSFHIYNTSRVVPVDQGEFSIEQFLAAYKEYVDQLKQGLIPNEEYFGPVFSSVFAVSPDQLYALPIGADQQLIRVAQPSIQSQMHRLTYSKADNKFHSMTFGIDAISWGLQFSYPQLYKDPVTQDIEKVDLRPQFPNSVLFQKMQRWVRRETTPTPFIVEGQQINHPVRLGKAALSWINQHRQLQEKNIKVLV